MSARHEEALSAFEENDEFDVIHSKLLKSKNLQKKQTTSTTEYFDWLREEIKLEKEVDAVTNQIETCLSNAVKAIKKEIVVEENVFKLCGIDKSSSTNAIASVKKNSLITSMHHLDTAHCERATSIVAAVEDVVATLKNCDSNPSKSNKIATCATIISDAKNELAKIDDNLHEEYCVLSNLLNEQKKSIMRLITSEVKETTESKSNGIDITSKISQHIQTLRQKAKDSGQVDDYEIDLLEYELKKEFRNAKMSYDDEINKLTNYDMQGSWDKKSESIFKSTLSICRGKSQVILISRLRKELPSKSVDEITERLTSHNDMTNRKRKMKVAANVFQREQADIERKGLKAIECIQREMTERSIREEETFRLELKRKEIALNLKQLQRKRLDANSCESNHKVQTEINTTTSAIEKEVNWMERRLEAKKCIWKQQNEALEEQLETILDNDFGTELNRMQRKKLNCKR